MSRIQELPDDFNEALDLNALTAGYSVDELEKSYAERFRKNPSAGADKPAPKTRSFEEVMSEISKTPLFMNSDDVNEANDAVWRPTKLKVLLIATDGVNNTALEAIRALQYEGTKAEIAQGFKEQGNEMVKAKMWSDAKEFYTKGVAVLTAKGTDDKWEQGEDPELEAKKEKELEEQIYVNRALCNLELKNYRSTTFDCAAALRLNPSNVKAYYRSASALLTLDKLLEAKDAVSRGLQLEPNNTSLKKLSTRIESRSVTKEALDRKAKLESERKGKESVTLYAALKARGILLKWSKKPPDLEDAGIHLSPDSLSPKSMLVFPVILLYPMHSQSDFIKAFAEKDKIVDHLSYILPLPWDTAKDYVLDDVQCYMDTPNGGLIKVGKKLSLLQVLANGKTIVMDGLVSIHVVPSKLAGKWIDEVKSKMGR